MATITTRARVLYFHGGPGFNGNPERELLVRAYADAGYDLRVWDEPSALRPEGPPFHSHDAFAGLLASAEAWLEAHRGDGPTVLMGHSFGTHPVRHLTARSPEEVALAVFVAPALDLAPLDRNLFEVALTDFERMGSPLADAMREVLAAYTGAFDANTEQGVSLALQDPELFGHYWRDHEAMKRFLPRYEPPRYAPDAEGYFAVRRSLTPIVLTGSPVQALAIFGAHDVVSPRAQQLSPVAQSYPRLEVRELAESAHYPHVEEVEAVLALLDEALEAR